MKVAFERVLLQLGLLIGGGGIIALLVALATQAVFDKSLAVVMRTATKCEVTWKGPKNAAGVEILACDEVAGWRNRNPRATYHVAQVDLADIAFSLASGETHYATVRLADVNGEGAREGDEITVLFNNEEPDKLRGAMTWMTLLKFFTVVLLGGAILFADRIMIQVEKAAERMPTPRPKMTTGTIATGNRHQYVRR